MRNEKLGTRIQEIKLIEVTIISKASGWGIHCVEIVCGKDPWKEKLKESKEE